MKIKFLLISALLFLVLIAPGFRVRAAEQVPPAALPPDTFYQGTVLEILNTTEAPDNGAAPQVRVQITNGDEKNNEVVADNMVPSNNPHGFKLAVGEKVIVARGYNPDGKRYFIVDLPRLTPMLLIFLVFIALIIFFGRLKGFTSLLGLLFSIGVLSKFVVPKIIAGNDPLTISLLGALMIIFVSLYLAHGFNKRTTIALGSTLITLGASALMAILFVKFTKLFGTGSEEALYLQFGTTSTPDLRGLLLGGIIIGTLGVLDDVTTGQTAAVYELQQANPDLSAKELYKRGIAVGKEHIASLVNTLALAYAGVSLPLFLLFSLYPDRPFWFIINGQNIAEEIIRTLVGSIALILAVPISTFLAAELLSRRRNK